MAFNHKVVKLLKDKYRVELHVSLPVGGIVQRMARTMTFPGLADFESLMGKVLADAEYMGLLDSAVQTFLDDTHDELWSVVI